MKNTIIEIPVVQNGFLAQICPIPKYCNINPIIRHYFTCNSLVPSFGKWNDLCAQLDQQVKFSGKTSNMKIGISKRKIEAKNVLLMCGVYKNPCSFWLNRFECRKCTASLFWFMHPEKTARATVFPCHRKYSFHLEILGT